ncbi:MAG TPA: hypothetical protein VE075_04710, partial [Thermoanaerobaculia bacterium]|nr:hypothetical protein [Thermoanaerobaculia bacterium]
APAPAEIATTAMCHGDEPPRPSSRKLARVVGVISAPGEELHRVTLTLQDRLTGNRWVVDQFERCKRGTSRAGRFAYSTELLPGTYDVTLAGKFYESEAASAVPLAANEVKEMDFSLLLEDSSVHPVIFALPLVFLVSIWLIRWNNIAKPSRLGVIAQLSELQGRFPPDSWYGGALGAAKQELEKKVVVLDWLFWSRGQEIASWNLAHKAELALLEDPAQTSLDKIDARLASAEQRLSEMDKGAARSLGQRVAAALAADPAKVGEPARRQLLIEATGYIYETGDSGFAALTGWQNKSFWLTLVGVALIWAVGLTEGHASLFLAGAVGGFLSRLTRELKRADVATDYGASWSTLFLSPVAGAISGWFGVALIMLMTDPTVGVLGGPLKVINWDSANVAATLAAAFILGFSERLFDRIVAQLDVAIDKKKEGAQKTASTASPAQGAPPAGDAAAVAVTAVAPNPVAAGGEVAAQLANVDAAKVTGVVLSAASGDLPAFEPRFEEGQLKFTVAADTAPGTYRIVLLTPELTPPRAETDQEITVSPKPAG